MLIKESYDFAVKKNYEWSKKIKSLKIAIPFNLVTVHYDSRCTTDLIVKVPLSAYTSTMASDAAALHTKLQNELPSTWCISSTIRRMDSFVTRNKCNYMIGHIMILTYNIYYTILTCDSI